MKKTILVITSCVTSACLNGGTCNSATGACTCMNGFTGSSCETSKSIYQAIKRFIYFFILFIITKFFKRLL